MDWVPGLYGNRRRARRESRPAIIEALEPRALLATVTVDVINFAFNPDPVMIHVGDTVHWVWQADDHTVTSVSGSAVSFESGVQNTGFTFNETFNQLGTIVYYCRIHGTDNGNGTASGMAGEVIVLPSPTPTPTPTPSPTPSPTPTPTPSPTPSIGNFRSHGLKIQATKDLTYFGYVALFNEPNTDSQDFHAFIKWGDKSKVKPGHIHGRGNGQYAVLSQHRYVKVGVFHVSVQIRDGLGRKVTTSSLVRVIPRTE
jgi:plastocyanin